MKRTKAKQGWSSGYQSATAAQFADCIVVYSQSIGIASHPIIRLRWPCEPTELADAVALCLSQSNDTWPVPSHVKQDRGGVLRAAGLKSWRAFKPIAMVSVDRNVTSKYIELDPLVRDGGGHSPASKRRTRIAADAPRAKLAAAILRALAKSNAAHGR